MKKIPVYLILLVLCLMATHLWAFDLKQAKSDYSGADFKISSIKETLYENAPAISINFTCPVLKDRLKNHHASISGGEFENWIVSEDQKSLIFPFVEPDKEYKIYVSQEIRDVNGQKLEDSKTSSIKTKKLNPGVNFSSKGSIITGSGPKSIPVTTLNIDEIDLDFYSINKKEIPSFLNYIGSTGSKSYYQLDKIKNYGNLEYSGRFALNPKKNQRTEYNIDIEDIQALKAPGLYAAVMRIPGTYEYRYEYTYFMQSDIGIHIRKYDKKFNIYAQNISTGQPIENAKIEIINNSGNSVNTGTTDAMGKTEFYIKSDQKYLIASKDDHISVLALNRNALDLSALKNAVSSHSEYQIYAFGPRDLYRPAEKIEVDVLVRNFDGRIPPSMPLGYALYKPDGSRVSSGDIQPDETGFYKFSYQTNENAQTGRYNLSLSFGKTNVSTYNFMVEEFLPERLDLELFENNTKDKITIGKTSLIKVPVQSNYLYGAPASGNKTDGFVKASVDVHPFENLKTFYFGDPKENISYTTRYFKEIKLSENGSGELQMENKWAGLKSPVKLNISASVYETGGRPVTRNKTITILNKDEFIGIEPQFKGNPDSDTTIEFKIGCVDKNEKWVKDKKINITLIRKDRNWYWTNSSSRGWHWAYNETPEVVYSKTIYTEDNAKTVAIPVTWGDYSLVASSQDNTSSYDFETSWSWWGNTDDNNSLKPDLVSLGFAKEEYHPGEMAKLKINPPESGTALINIETSEGVLYSQYVQVEKSGTIIEIPTKESWNRHDIYASVMVIRPGDKKETPVPARSFGMVHLNLKRANTKFEVSIDAPKKAEPNKKISATIKIDSQKPLPKNTKAVVALVDVGILNITRFKTPDAYSYFFAPRRYNVDLFDNYGNIIDNIGPKNALQRFGGGFMDSEAELARGGNKPKSDVMMVSFFSDPIAVDENQEVKAEFKLPDFNGKLRWMVLVFSDNEFGNADFDTNIADKVVTQVSMPRFLASGDKSTIAVDLRNMSGEAQDLFLDVKFDKGIFGTSEIKQAKLEDKEKAAFKFEINAVKADGMGTITANIYNTNKSIDITRTWNIGLRSPYPSVSRSESVMIKPGDSWVPKIKTDDIKQDTAMFQLTLTNRAPIDLKDHLKYLLHYPYGCLEQSVSSGYPWIIATPENVSLLGIKADIENQFDREFTNEFRNEQIQKAVRLVLDKQKNNGSFGLWSSTSPEEKWLTVYAADFLNDAKKAGAAVDSNSLNSVNRMLSKYLRGSFSKNYNRWSQDIDHYEFAFRSYAGYVLAKNEKASLSDLRRLYAQFKDKTEDDGLSWFYLAAAFKMSGDYKNAANAYGQGVEDKEREQYKYYGEYGSKLRDLSKMAEIMIQYNFGTKDKFIFNLADAVKERTWMSTQERISLFKTAVVLDSMKNDFWNAQLVADSGVQNIKKDKSFNSVFNYEKFTTLKEIKADQSGNNIYGTITLVGEYINAPNAVSNDISIERTFYDTSGNSLVLDQMKSGELAVVRLDITAKKRTPDGLVVDLLPAGLEIENQNLGLASVKLDDILIEGKKIGSLKQSRYMKHEEFRDDRYVAAVEIPEYGKLTLFYLVRAVTPGVYKMPCSYAEDMYRPYRFAIGKTIKEIEIFE